ncbi:MAG: NDP-sugar synthase [Promethearchaeota archaeon]|nr:MAG: NDP-sugar synthase [Candidatus Lokiarchaeota archaeon]
MQIICPLAGVGKRLQPFTFSKPKAFLKVAGKRAIDHILLKLERTFPKDTNICFIVGYKKRQIIEYLRRYLSGYFKLEFIEQEPLGYSADEPFFSGLGDAILLAKNLAQNDDCFIFLSDRLPIEDYSQMLLTFHSCDCDGVINVRKVENPQYYGVVVIDEENYITKIMEKPLEPISNYAVSGAYVFGHSMTPRLFKLLEEQSKKPLQNGEEHQLTPVIQKLIMEGSRIKISEMNQEVLDFGRPNSLLDANRALLSDTKITDPLYENKVASRNIVNSKINPPVYIGENVSISNSVIGPNVSLGDNLFIEKCIISESVIGDAVQLKKTITSNSIIGDYSILEDLIKKGITIGDSSYIATSTD